MGSVQSPNAFMQEASGFVSLNRHFMLAFKQLGEKLPLRLSWDVFISQVKVASHAMIFIHK